MTKKNYLYEYLLRAPLSLAMERSLECGILAPEPMPGPVLDLGCGDGLFADVLGRVPVDLGMDLDRREILIAGKRGIYKALEVADIRIANPGRTFNTIFSNSVLEHIADLKPVLRSVRAILSEDGFFYVTVPTDRFFSYSMCGAILKRLIPHGFPLCEKWYNSFWRHYHAYSPGKWRDIFEAAGFNVTEVKEYGSMQICMMNDMFMPLALCSAIVKKLTGRWVLSESLRRIYIYPLYAFARRMVERFEARPSKGGLVFFKLRKGQGA